MTENEDSEDIEESELDQVDDESDEDEGDIDEDEDEVELDLNIQQKLDRIKFPFKGKLTDSDELAKYNETMRFIEEKGRLPWKFEWTIVKPNEEEGHRDMGGIVLRVVPDQEFADNINSFVNKISLGKSRVEGAKIVDVEEHKKKPDLEDKVFKDSYSVNAERNCLEVVCTDTLSAFHSKNLFEAFPHYLKDETLIFQNPITVQLAADMGAPSVMYKDLPKEMFDDDPRKIQGVLGSRRSILGVVKDEITSNEYPITVEQADDLVPRRMLPLMFSRALQKGEL